MEQRESERASSAALSGEIETFESDGRPRVCLSASKIKERSQRGRGLKREALRAAGRSAESSRSSTEKPSPPNLHIDAGVPDADVACAICSGATTRNEKGIEQAGLDARSSNEKPVSNIELDGVGGELRDRHLRDDERELRGAHVDSELRDRHLREAKGKFI